jgi:signal transduction histidine kinase
LDVQAIHELRTKGICRRFEKYYIHKSGRQIPVAYVGAMLENSEDIIGFVTDLTPQKELEKLRTEFLSIVTHELRNPLAGIRGCVQLARRRSRRLFEDEGIASPQIEKKRRDTNIVLENALHQTDVLDRLISDLIETVRITSGQLTLLPRPCDLRQLVQETVDLQRLAAPDRKLALENDAGESIPLIADADRIGQVLTNYITNALKYSPPDEPVIVGLALQEHEVRVWVRDRGPGLSPEAQKHIWERFYRQPDAIDYSGHGVNLGLGLFVCQTIITSHHGQVGVDSQPGKGATFWFSLPHEVPKPETLPQNLDDQG